MERKLVKHGSSYALIIEKPILELLGIHVDSMLSITTDGRALFITPAAPDGRRKRFKTALVAGNRKYKKALKMLSR